MIEAGCKGFYLNKIVDYSSRNRFIADDWIIFGKYLGTSGNWTREFNTDGKWKMFGFVSVVYKSGTPN